jgi:hypothetical protein
LVSVGSRSPDPGSGDGVRLDRYKDAPIYLTQRSGCPVTRSAPVRGNGCTLRRLGTASVQPSDFAEIEAIARVTSPR